MQLFEDTALTPRPDGLLEIIAAWERQNWTAFDELLEQHTTLAADPLVRLLAAHRGDSPVLRFDEK